MWWLMPIVSLLREAEAGSCLGYIQIKSISMPKQEIRQQQEQKSLNSENILKAPFIRV